MVELLGSYAALLVTGFPFLFFCAHGGWSLFRRRWAWDRTRKLLFANAAAYPLVFAALFLLVVGRFGVYEELKGALTELGAANPKAGDQLGALLAGFLLLLGHFGAALAATCAVGLAYSVASTALLLRLRPESEAWRPFALAGVTALGLIQLGFWLRTPLFNLVGSLVRQG